ncbi:MAG: LysM peptidoglycan-binding domain-containing protein [Gammaproteobacteria bacterium]
MGFFDSIKKAMGGKGDAEASVKGPSMVLKEAGIDPEGLRFTFGQGSIGVAGRVPDEAAAEKIVAALEGMPNIERVDNHLELGPPPAAPEPEVAVQAAAPEPPVADATGAVESAETGEVTVESPGPDAGEGGTEAGGRTYEVQPGDSLWKIAAEVYGNGAEYPKIFEANRDILDDPDLIRPGQVLRIPDPD